MFVVRDHGEGRYEVVRQGVREVPNQSIRSKQVGANLCRMPLPRMKNGDLWHLKTNLSTVVLERELITYLLVRVTP